MHSRHSRVRCMHKEAILTLHGSIIAFFANAQAWVASLLGAKVRQNRETSIFYSTIGRCVSPPLGTDNRLDSSIAFGVYVFSVVNGRTRWAFLRTWRGLVFISITIVPCLYLSFLSRYPFNPWHDVGMGQFPSYYGLSCSRILSCYSCISSWLIFS